MDVDALLELIGIKPRQAQGATMGTLAGQVGAGSSGQYEVYPGGPARNQTAELPPRPVDQPSDLMSILQRNQANPGGYAETSNPNLQGVAAGVNNTLDNGREYLGEQQASISGEQQRLTELEAMMAQEAEREQVRQNLNPPRNAPVQSAGTGANGMSMPAAPLRAPNPGQPPNPLNQQPNPVFASLERTGPPLRNIADPPQQPIPARQPPPVPIDQAPPVFANGGNMPGMPQLPANIPVNGGPFQTMEPPNPFMPESGPGPSVTPIASSSMPPPPSEDYMIPGRNRQAISPFYSPSPATSAIRPQGEGMPILNPPPAPMSVTTGPATPFAPEGQVIDWFMGRNQAPGRGRSQPTTPSSAVSSPAPTPSSGPNQSTILNQAELQRFLSASPGGTPAPPAPSAPPPSQMASVPPVPQVPLPAGATPMSPPAPPAPGNQMPEALKQQLLAEAYRLVSQRGGQQPQTLGAR